MLNLVSVLSKATGFQTFTPLEYIKIDAMNQYGFDRETFESRIATFDSYEGDWHDLVQEADCPPLFLKAIFAYEDSKAGKPSGHLVGLDCCASGVQIMSAMTGCIIGATNTGLVVPNLRKDLYTDSTNVMNTMLPIDQQVRLGGVTEASMAYKGKEYSRDDVKLAEMTHFYGSFAEPIRIFGKGTAHFKAFYMAVDKVAPGANSMTDMLINYAWQPMALAHSLTMPDGFHIVLRNMVEKTVVVRIDELKGQFSHIIRVNEGEEKGVSLVANVTHGADAFVVREMGRRCDYNKLDVSIGLDNVSTEMALRSLTADDMPVMEHRDFLATNVALTVSMGCLEGVSDIGLLRIHNRLSTMALVQPFNIICNHDEFKSHANYSNTVRYWFKEIMAELAESCLLEDILRELTGNNTLKVQKDSEGLAALIRNSNYGLS